MTVHTLNDDLIEVQCPCCVRDLDLCCYLALIGVIWNDDLTQNEVFLAKLWSFLSTKNPIILSPATCYESNIYVLLVSIMSVLSHLSDFVKGRGCRTARRCSRKAREPTVGSVELRHCEVIESAVI